MNHTTQVVIISQKHEPGCYLGRYLPPGRHTSSSYSSIYRCNCPLIPRITIYAYVYRIFLQSSSSSVQPTLEAGCLLLHFFFKTTCTPTSYLLHASISVELDKKFLKPQSRQSRVEAVVQRRDCKPVTRYFKFTRKNAQSAFNSCEPQIKVTDRIFLFANKKKIKKKY